MKARSLRSLTDVDALIYRESKAHAYARARHLFTRLAEALGDGDRFTVPGFGVFEVRTAKARTVMNPATRELMTLPAQRTVKFRAAKRLKAAVR